MSAAIYWNKGASLSMIYKALANLGCANGYAKVGRTDDWTKSFNEGRIDDALTEKIRPYCNARWSFMGEHNSDKIEFVWQPQHRHRSGAGISLLRAVPSVDIMHRWFNDEVPSDWENENLEREIRFYDFMKLAVSELQADVVCGSDTNGYDLSVNTEADCMNEYHLFNNSHFVFRPRGWQKLIYHIERKMFLRIDEDVDDTPLFIFYNLETGEEMLSSEMYPERVRLQNASI